MSIILVQLITGLAGAASLFLISVGLSLIFGVTRIVNFAHGSFYMLGAYLGLSLWQWLPDSPWGFWGAMLGAALGVGLIGVLVEGIILRRIYQAPELFQLLATFAVVLVVEDMTLWIWGPEDRIGPQAPGLTGSVALLGAQIPEYDLFLIALSPVVLGALGWLFHRTRWGILVRAATADRDMVDALGVDQTRLFSSVFFLGAFLAGLGGALQLPKGGADLGMDLSIIAVAFVVVVVGGMGSLWGAFLAALLIGVINALGVLLFPAFTLVLTFVVMAVVLAVRPYGLAGRAPSAAGGDGSPGPLLLPPGWQQRYAELLLAGLLLVLPWLVGDYGLILAVEILIAALFAASLQLLLGPGGLISFGHAAHFGLGAYGAGLLVKYAAAPLGLALPAGMLLGGAGAVLIGAFCVRLSGVYLAMLTLAFAQILWSLATQWYSVTGGDDGILGVWPPPWASSRVAFYYLTLTLALLSYVGLQRLVYSPFGYALRAGRDSPRRAAAIGIAVQRQQWAAFVVAGALAGLAGALFAYSKGTVFPDVLAIARSVDGLVMVLLGGVQSLLGPWLGGGAFTSLQDSLSRLSYWRLLLGVVLLVVVMVFPRGLVGVATTLSGWRRQRR